MNAAQTLLVLAAAAAGGAFAADPKADALAADSSLAAALTKARPAASVGDLLAATTVDMPVAVAPAAFLLGVAGTDVPRVATLREFGAQIGRAIGEDGKLRNSVAAEVNPRLAIGKVAWDDFQKSYATQVLTRTTVSFANVADPGAGEARSAIGLQSVLWSAEVPRLIDAASTGPCASVAAAFAAKPSGTVPGALAPGSIPVLEPSADAEKARADCKARIEGLLTKWNPTAVTVGLGQSFFSQQASIGGLRRAASGVWITGSWGTDLEAPDSAAPAQDRMGFGATLHLRRMRHERVADPADAARLVDESSTLVGLNLRGGSGKFGGLLEASQRKSTAATLADERRKRWFAGLEYRLRPDLYLVAGVGNDTGRRGTQDERTTLVHLKWGFSPESVLR
jgi:hypothetical protein